MQESKYWIVIFVHYLSRATRISNISMQYLFLVIFSASYLCHLFPQLGIISIVLVPVIIFVIIIT